MKVIKTASGNQIKISKSEWKSIGKTAGWMKEGAKWVATDSDFNKANYPKEIGKTYDNPPSYVQVKEIEETPVTDEEINQLSYFMDTVSNNMEALKRVLDLVSRDPSYKEEYEMAISMVAKIGNASRELYTPPVRK